MFKKRLDEFSDTPAKLKKDIEKAIEEYNKIVTENAKTKEQVSELHLEALRKFTRAEKYFTDGEEHHRLANEKVDEATKAQELADKAMRDAEERKAQIDVELKDKRNKLRVQEQSIEKQKKELEKLIEENKKDLTELLKEAESNKVVYEGLRNEYEAKLAKLKGIVEELL